MASIACEKAAVYIVDVPEDFKPLHPWDYPDQFTGGELFTKNLFTYQTVGSAFAFNKRQIALSMAERKWAIATRWVKPRRRRAQRPLSADGHVLLHTELEFPGPGGYPDRYSPPRRRRAANWQRA
jgi:hypothetical protein